MTVELILALASGIVAIVFVVVYVVLSIGCPKCQSRDPLIETGITKLEHWYSLTRFEYRCKHCGHVVWKLTSLNAAE